MMFSSGPRTNTLYAIATLTLLQLAAPGLAGALASSISTAAALHALLINQKP
ncbi:hypothetical protein ACIOEZ_34470 [Streptomyces sp. NPDC087866]|uniref:hypothetical protein n=1 Tax=Streptomyces sp. NPDC087866 TaxID=3365815 RepID=UPI00382DBF76